MADKKSPASSSRSNPSSTSMNSDSSISIARSIQRKLANLASTRPIELIVGVFCLVTIAYFQLLHAVTNSNFFEPLNQEVSRNHNGIYANDDWWNFSWGADLQESTTGTSGLSSSTSSSSSSSSSSGQQSSNGNGMVYVLQSDSKDWIPLSQFTSSQDENKNLDHLFDEATTYFIDPILILNSDDSSYFKDSALSSIATTLKSQLSTSINPSISSPKLIKSENTSAYSIGVWTRDSNSSSSFRKSNFLNLSSFDFLSSVLEGSNSSPSSSSNSKPQSGKAKDNSIGEEKQGQDWRLLPLLPDSHSQRSGATEELRSIRWAAYAVRALVVRFWALIKKADSADIFVMLSAYILMHGTFVNLFLSMRKFGSKFWLGTSVLTSSTFAFLLALTTAYLLNVTVDPIGLSEALPFLVIIVGFEKPFLLTRTVFTHPGLAPSPTSPTKDEANKLLSAVNESSNPGPGQDSISPTAEGINGGRSSYSQEESFVKALTARLKTEPTLRWAVPQPVPAKTIVTEAVDKVGMSMVRDYCIEIAVMAVGATSGVSGLREFCQLAALILIFDCVFLFSFYAAILTVMVEVHRIKILRGMPRPKPLRASTPPNVDDGDCPTPTSASSDSLLNREVSPSRRKQVHPSVWKKTLRLIFGTSSSNEGPSGLEGNGENPVARLKVLLITAFLTLHSLNLISTLTTQSAITRHHHTSEPSPYQNIIGSSSIFSIEQDSQLISPLLESILQSQSKAADRSNLIARVSTPTILVLVDASPSASGTRSDLASAALNASGAIELSSSSSSRTFARYSHGRSQMASSRNSASVSSMAVLDSFMSGWTIIVGDPVISKWMSLALAISIFLNAYLLKGIATGNAAVADGNAAGAAAYAAARMIGAHLDSEERGRSNLSIGKSSNGANERSRSRPALATRDSSSHQELNDYHKRLAASVAAVGKTGEVQLVKPVAVPARPVVEKDGATPDEGATPSQQTISLGNSTTQDGKVVVRPLDELVDLYAGGAGVYFLTDEEIVVLAQKGKIATYALEKILQDNERAVKIRRALISRASTTKTLESSLLPHAAYNYSQVIGACCENVVGFMPIPVGIAGPLTIDGQVTPIPMATTEGTLVASTSRGCKALNAGGGVTTVLTQDAMTRGPAIEFPSIVSAAKAKRWIDSKEGASTIKAAFDSTSRFARLSHLRCVLAGRTLYVRFATATGDAMGMNMISKGVEKALAMMTSDHFPEMKVLSLSGNYCTDKKPAAINWIEGRGKSVVAEAVIPGNVVSSVLKCTVEDLVNLNTKKNLIGSAMAGSIGGFNAHAANILTAIYIATGQDPAQNVESSNCITLMESINDGKDLLVTVSMPSIEVGTVGGGTILSPQRAMLEMIGVAGANQETPGANAQRLARIIAAAVMAGELSLMGALSAGHLIQAHMKHNRSVPSTPGTQTPGIPSRPETPKHFAGLMTPLVAPPIQSARTSPSNSISESSDRISGDAHSRRSASSTH